MAARPSSLRDERSVNLSSGSSLTYMEGFGPCCSLLAVKSVWQHYAPTRDVLGLLEVFRRMVNESIRIGLANSVSSLRKLSLLSYNQLAHCDSPSCYKLCAISRAAGILAARKKSHRRGFTARTPYAVKQQLVSCYGFKTKNGGLEIPVSRGKRLSIPLTKHTLDLISTRNQGSLFHPHTEQALPLHRPRRSHDRMRLHRGCGPKSPQSHRWKR